MNKNFAQFGMYCLILAILSLVAFIFGIGGMFVTVLQYVNWVVQLVIIVVIILAIIAIGKAGNELKNENVLGFRNFIVIAIILVTIGLILLGVGIGMILTTATGQTSLDPGSPEAIQIYITWGILILVGLIMIIIGAILEIFAWGKLKRFFINNMSMFPDNIGSSAKTGATLCQIGAILNLTIILAFIGWILKVIGYFMLSKLKELK